jgi:threonine dehydratase
MIHKASCILFLNIVEVAQLNLFHAQNKTEQANQMSIRNIWEARKRISSIVKRTPILRSSILSEKVNADVYLKLENFHEIGAFKVRGAANKILSLSVEEQQRGVTTFSTGNHGLAVAFVAKKLGIKAVICISRRVPEAKVDAIRRLGAELHIEGNSQDEAGINCFRLQEEQGLTVIKPFDDPYVVAGQGTIGLELLEDLPDLDKVIVPLSGGGLLAGIGLALKSNDPNIQVTGVSMEHSAVMYESLKAGKPVVMEEQNTLADSLLGGIGLDNQYTFNMVQQVMDDVMLVPEEEISESMAFMLHRHRMVIEGAAGTGIAALLRKKDIKPGSQVAIIISGNNVDISELIKISQNYVIN